MKEIDEEKIENFDTPLASKAFSSHQMTRLMPDQKEKYEI